MRTILHSDCNGFYASVECLYDPEIRDKPVAVGGDVEKRHGIILAKNEHAKKYKIKTGEAIWQAKQKCPSLVVVPPNYERYLRFSKLCRRIYGDYTDRIENFGLDEAWLDVTGSARLFGGGEKIADEIRRRVKSELGITVSVGVSYNKIFAKLGSDYKKPDAITVITPDNFREIVWPLKAEDLLYVGPHTKVKLNRLGVRTIGELASFPLPLLREIFGKWGDILHSFSNGYDSSPVSHCDETASIKSIGNSTTCVRDLENFEDVKIVMMVLCDSVCRRLREHGATAQTVSVSVRDCELFSFIKQKKRDRPTDITEEVLDTALELFKANYRWQKNIRSLGVCVSDLKSKSFSEQLSLFCDESKREKYKSLDISLDRLKERFGSFCVRPAKLMLDPKLSGFSPKEEHVIHPVGYF